MLTTCVSPPYTQAGSNIVEALRTYRYPVFVYIPCNAELRCALVCCCACTVQ